MIVLSHIQTTPLLKARHDALTAFALSLDLNLSQSEVQLDPDGVTFPDGQRLAWERVEEISAREKACYVVQNGELERVTFFSEAFQRVYSLFPTERAPTMLLASFPMHRIKGIDPREDTRRKLQTIAPLIGRALDTTTGLGYTAIQAAQTASEVVTIELDPTVLEVARRNPWSQALFTDPRIQQKIGSAADVVPTLESQSFTRILHDPPTFQLAGELYSERFYRELFRVLKRGGRLFHYIGDLESASGSSVAKGVVRRLQNAGFTRVRRAPEAFGLTASRD